MWCGGGAPLGACVLHGLFYRYLFQSPVCIENALLVAFTQLIVHVGFKERKLTSKGPLYWIWLLSSLFQSQNQLIEITLSRLLSASLDSCSYQLHTCKKVQNEFHACSTMYRRIGWELLLLRTRTHYNPQSSSTLSLSKLQERYYVLFIWKYLKGRTEKGSSQECMPT
jgi:hypothetical protein